MHSFAGVQSSSLTGEDQQRHVGFELLKERAARIERNRGGEAAAGPAERDERGVAAVRAAHQADPFPVDVGKRLQKRPRRARVASAHERAHVEPALRCIGADAVRIAARAEAVREG